MTSIKGAHARILLCAALPCAAAASEPADRPAGAIEEVVVTAEKTEKSLQDTPLAITAMTGEMLEQRGISDVSGLNTLAPNLSVATTSSSTSNVTVFIRGIGNNDPILTADPAVAIYVDGVIVGRQAGAAFDLVDLERVEVLRGPQGTLYGRNTTGGVVNLITRKPSSEFGLSQQLGFGDYGRFLTRSSLDTGELGTSGLAAKLSYVHQRGDGYVDDLLEPKERRDPGALRLDAWRAALRYDADGALTVDYAFDYNDRVGVAAASQMAVATPQLQAFMAQSPGFDGTEALYSQDRLERLTLDTSEPSTDEVSGHSLIADWSLDDTTTLRSVSGYREWENVNYGDDIDGNGGLRGFTVDTVNGSVGPSDYVLFASDNVRAQEQWSQELNLIGRLGERLDYVLGAYWFREEAREYNNQFYTAVVSTNTLGFINDPAAPPLTGLELGSLLDYDHESETSALFGQTTYLVGERLSLTGGLRYTRDDKRLTQRSPQPPAPRVVDTDSSELNWMANALYLWSEDVSTYLRVSTGYKAGGSNARSVNPSFEPERITSYELGLKSTWLERRLQLNLAAFYSQYRDLQVQQFEAGSGGATSITVNAGRARYLGLEVELQAYLTNALSVSANLGLLDPKYEEFLYVDPACDPATEPDGDCRIDIADQAEFPYTSKLTADVGLQYALPSLAFGTPLLRVDYSYRSELYYHPFTALAEDIKAPGQGLLGARLALSEIGLGGLTLEAAIWGRNLLDEDYVASGIDFGGLQYGIRNYGPPRTVGLDLKIEYR